MVRPQVAKAHKMSFCNLPNTHMFQLGQNIGIWIQINDHTINLKVLIGFEEKQIYFGKVIVPFLDWFKAIYPGFVSAALPSK